MASKLVVHVLVVHVSVETYIYVHLINDVFCV